jgi:hypothetical protein
VRFAAGLVAVTFFGVGLSHTAAGVVDPDAFEDARVRVSNERFRPLLAF